jgi:hypothetical protein
MATHVLYESASGYAVFECNATDEIGASAEAVKTAVT